MQNYWSVSTNYNKYYYADNIIMIKYEFELKLYLKKHQYYYYIVFLKKLILQIRK